MAMLDDAQILELIRKSGLQFFVQESDVIHLCIDRQLGGSPYMQPFEPVISTVSYNTDGQWNVGDEGSTTAYGQRFNIPDGEIWILSKVTHRDLTPSIFYMELKADGQSIFPRTVMESPYYLLEFPKPVICMKYLDCRIYNADTVSRTYRQLRHFYRYSKEAVCEFLEQYGIERLR